MGILISDTAWSTPQEDHTPTCLIDAAGLVVS